MYFEVFPGYVSNKNSLCSNAFSALSDGMCSKIIRLRMAMGLSSTEMEVKILQSISNGNNRVILPEKIINIRKTGPKI